MLYDKFTNDLLAIVRQAGEIALNYYDPNLTSDLGVQFKSDNTPVTFADLKINEFLTKQLRLLTPDFAIVSEEMSVAVVDNVRDKNYWMIDPLDGTKHFINHQGQFSIMLAVFIKNHPKYSLIYRPLDRSCYIATADKMSLLGVNAEGNSDNTKNLVKNTKSYKIFNIDQPQNFIELNSRATFDVNKPIKVTHGHRNNMDSIYKIFNPKFKYEFIPYGSAGLKGGLVAEGKADIYISPHATGLWDVAPAQALIENSGGIVRDLKFNTINYDCTNLSAPPFFIGRDASWNWQEILNLY